MGKQRKNKKQDKQKKQRKNKKHRKHHRKTKKTGTHAHTHKIIIKNEQQQKLKHKIKYVKI